MPSLKAAAVAGLVMLAAAPLGGCVVVSYGPAPVYVESGPNQASGAIAGALLGGAIGSAFGRGGGAVAATLAGAAIGGLVGGAIGRDLDEAEHRMALAAEREAFRSGRTRRWAGERGIYGEIRPGPVYLAEEARCREFTHTIHVDGRPRTAQGVACEMPDRTWRIVG